MKRYFLYFNPSINLDFKYVIIATSFESPLLDYKEIEKQLNLQDFKGFVLFDMLAYSGDNSDRFFKLTFTDGHFDFATLEYLTFSKENFYRKNTQEVLKYKEFNLDNTVLSYVQKNMILHDLTI